MNASSPQKGNRGAQWILRDVTPIVTPTAPMWVSEAGLNRQGEQGGRGLTVSQIVRHFFKPQPTKERRGVVGGVLMFPCGRTSRQWTLDDLPNRVRHFSQDGLFPVVVEIPERPVQTERKH